MADDIENLLEFCAQYHVVSLMKNLPICRANKIKQQQPVQAKIRRSKFENPVGLLQKTVIKSKFQKPDLPAKVHRKQYKQNENENEQEDDASSDQQSPMNSIAYFINHLSSNTKHSKILEQAGLVKTESNGFDSFKNKHGSSYRDSFSKYQTSTSYKKSMKIPNFTQKISRFKMEDGFGSYADKMYQQQKVYYKCERQKSPYELLQQNRPHHSKYELYEHPHPPVKKGEGYHNYPSQRNFQMDRSQLSSRTYEPNLLYQSPAIYNKKLHYSPVRRDRQSMLGSTISYVNLDVSPESSRRDRSISRSKRKEERPFYEPPKKRQNHTVNRNWQQRESQVQINAMETFQISGNKRRTAETEFPKKPALRRSELVEMGDDLKDYLTMASQSRNAPNPIEINLSNANWIDSK